jgi:hypothetical protein
MARPLPPPPPNPTPTHTRNTQHATRNTQHTIVLARTHLDAAVCIQGFRQVLPHERAVHAYARGHEHNVSRQRHACLGGARERAAGCRRRHVHPVAQQHLRAREDELQRTQAVSR